MAAFHLEGEANQWWQWMKKVHRKENVVITWEIFEKELLVSFGQPRSKITMKLYHESIRGALYVSVSVTLRDWPIALWDGHRKLLWGHSLGQKDEIMEGVRMFKPHTLWDAIELARMHDDFLARQR